MTPRTLRRWLQDEGTSVRQIKESLRREFALRLLSNEHLSVQEVAEQSGFAEVAAFCRAFKRWTGATTSAMAKRPSIGLMPDAVATATASFGLWAHKRKRPD
jgi:AraC-type DNA-binding domain-containing proteins